VKKILKNIYGILLIFFSIVFISYLMPKKKKFLYEVIEGKTWNNSDLISDLEFSVLKHPNEIKKEKNEVEKQKKIFFTRNNSYNEIAYKNLKYELEKFQNQSNINSNINELFKNKIYEIFNKIQSKGLIESNYVIQDKPDNYIIYVVENNITRINYLNVFYSIDKATELIKNINIKNKKRKNEAISILLKSIKPNIIFNDYLTKISLEADLKKISNVTGKIRIGEVIISKGEIVDNINYLKLLSYKNEFERKQLSDSSNILIFLGQFIIVSICFLIISIFIFKIDPTLFQNLTFLKFILTNIILFICLAKFTLLFEINFSIYIVPFCALPLIIRSFYNINIAMIVYTITIILIGWISPNSFHFVFIQLMSGFLALLTIKNLYKRADLFFSVVKISLVYIITFFAISIISNQEIEKQNLLTYCFLVLSSFLTLLTYPIVYMNEKIFSLLSDTTLLELSDTNQPLLKKLSDIAPGTFQHSIQVSNLAENAINQIGGNTLLVRTGALYHDVGKINSPKYFIENQSNHLNPHDELSNIESAKIIKSHVIEGIEIAKKNLLPNPIIDFIRTHHGDGLIQFFYKKYSDNFPTNLNSEKEFRYNGPKPYSKETVVIMMADAVEASSRSLKKINKESITELVNKIISSQLNDNQYNNSPISLKDIETIKEIFIKKLLEINHIRIEYPEIN
tara:strand:- start:4494 stop:6539 length:2046 start_codon:yes stop_codon:yes gene_type:complete